MFYFRDNETREDLLVRGKDYSTFDFLNWSIELIEDNEIDIDSIEELNDTCYDDYLIAREKEFYHNLTRTRINELIQAVKQLDKEIKKLEELDIEVSEKDINEAINKARRQLREE